VTLPKGRFDGFDSVEIHPLENLDFIIGVIVIVIVDFVRRATPKAKKQI
jgi:hypothetical protein